MLLEAMIFRIEHVTNCEHRFKLL